MTGLDALRQELLLMMVDCRAVCDGWDAGCARCDASFIANAVVIPSVY
jgi:hypothetical protein